MHNETSLQSPFSLNKARNKKYQDFLEKCRESSMTVQDIIQFGYKLMRKEKLHHHFFGDYSLLATAQYLAHFSLQLPYEYDHSRVASKKITEAEAAKVFAVFERRISERLPVGYISQETWYMGNKFYINENVLVPRSVMSTRFQDFLQETNWQNYRVLDLCTGSGCIGITLALLNPNITVDLVDISKDALEVANINIQRHALEGRIKCIESDLFENVQGTYDLIITNPPYVSISEYKSCHPEFKREPKLALEAGKDGLKLLHKILANAKKHLNPEGTLIAEVGITAAKRLKKQYRKIPFKWFTYRRPNGKRSLFDRDCIFLLNAKEWDGFIYDPTGDNWAQQASVKLYIKTANLTKAANLTWLFNTRKLTQ